MPEILDALLLCLLAIVPIVVFGILLLGWWFFVGRKATSELWARHAREEAKFLARDPRCAPALVPHYKRVHSKCPTVWIVLPAVTFDQPGVGRA